MLLKFYYAENRKIKKLSHVVTTENKYKYIHFYLYNPFGVDFFKFSKKSFRRKFTKRSLRRRHSSRYRGR